MAGTLALLAAAGFEPHMMNLARSNLDSNELPEAEIARIRRREAEAIGGRDRGRLPSAFGRRPHDFLQGQAVAAGGRCVRGVRPHVVLLPSLNDYMEDHTNTARLVVTACFSRAMRHYVSDPPRGPTDQDIYLYQAQPHLNRTACGTWLCPSCSSTSPA